MPVFRLPPPIVDELQPAEHRYKDKLVSTTDSTDEEYSTNLKITQRQDADNTNHSNKNVDSCCASATSHAIGWTHLPRTTL